MDIIDIIDIIDIDIDIEIDIDIDIEIDIDIDIDIGMGIEVYIYICIHNRYTIDYHDISSINFGEPHFFWATLATGFTSPCNHTQT